MQKVIYKFKNYVSEYHNIITNGRFMRLITAGITSSFGSKISYFALLKKVYDLSGGSVTDLGFLTMVEMLPFMLFSSFAGFVADKVSRKWTMILSDIMNGLIMLSVIFIDDISLIYIIAFAASTVNSFREPAQRAFEPNLVKKEDIPLLNSFMASTHSLVQIIGSATGAAVVGFVGVNTAFVIDAMTFWASALILTTIILKEKHLEKVDSPKKEETALKQFVNGVSIMWDDKKIRLMVLIEVFLTFAMSMQGILIYYFIKQTLKMGDKAEMAWGTLLSALGFGAVVGSFVIGILVKRYKNKFKLFLNVLLFDAIAFSVFLVNKFFPLSILLFTLLGVIGVAHTIILNSVLQATVSDVNRGKVFGAMAMLRGPISISSVFLGTTAANYVTAQLVLLIAAALEVLIAVGVRFTKAYRDVDSLVMMTQADAAVSNDAE